MSHNLSSLVLIRHGKPEDFGPDGTDESRRLTAAGVEELRERFARELAPRLAGQDVRIWTSPAVRARQTAHLAAEALGISPAAIEECSALYEQDDVEFLAELEAMGEGTVVAVGHIPFMDRFCWSLTGEPVSFLQGTVCCVRPLQGDLRRGTVQWTIGAGA